MGLDQYAYITSDVVNKIVNSEGDSESNIDDVTVKNFYWRKHSRLQTFMEHKYTEKTGNEAGGLNCEYMELDQDDLDQLQSAVNDGYRSFFCEGGFFYGHQFQEEVAAEEKDNDLEFCQAAREAINSGHRVYYSCWW